MSIEFSSAQVVTRAKNCAAAAMLGDALGAAYEGHSFEEILRSSGPLGCRAHKAASHMGVYNLGDRFGCYTDDTNSAVAILRSTLAMGHINGGDIAYRHARQWLDGYSLDFRRGYPESAQAMMLETLNGSGALDCATVSFSDGSFANGAAMKVWPIAVAMHDVKLVGHGTFYEAVKASCCFSHVHPQGIDAAASLAETIRWALHYKLSACLSPSSNTDLDPAPSPWGGGEVMGWNPRVDGALMLKVAHEASREPVVKAKLGELRRAFETAPPPPAMSTSSGGEDKPTPEQYMEEVAVLHSMLAPICGRSLAFQIEGWAGIVCALAVASRHGAQVADVIAYSIGIGGDTDTVASMAGAVSGALNGSSNPQKEWYPGDPTVWGSLENRTEEGIYGRDWIVGAAAELAATPLTDVRMPLPGVSAASCGPRTPADKAGELCGAYWRNPFQSTGFDALRQSLFSLVMGSNSTNDISTPSLDVAVFRQIAPMAFNRFKDPPGITAGVVAAVEERSASSSSSLSEAEWMTLTDPATFTKNSA